MNHVFRNVHRNTGRGPRSGKKSPSLSQIEELLSGYQRAVDRSIKALAEEMTESRRRSNLSDELAGLSDHLLEDIGVDRAEIPGILARAKQKERSRR